MSESERRQSVSDPAEQSQSQTNHEEDQHYEEEEEQEDVEEDQEHDDDDYENNGHEEEEEEYRSGTEQQQQQGSVAESNLHPDGKAPEMGTQRRATLAPEELMMRRKQSLYAAYNGDPVAFTLDQLPQGLLKFDDPVVMEMDDPIPGLPAAMLQQRETLSETPVVTTTDRILDSILPPRVTRVDDVPIDYQSSANASQSATPLFSNTQKENTASSTKSVKIVERVSHTQFPRNQLSALRQLVEFKLVDAKSRDSGICPVRRQIMTMLFDEMLRQVTIDLPERGLLLLRIRDELRMTLEAYETLYSESTAYSTRKMHQATKHTPAMMQRIADLSEDVKVLKKELRRLDAKEEALNRCVEEQKNAQLTKHRIEKNFMENTKQRLLQHLEAVKEAQAAERRALHVDA